MFPSMILYSYASDVDRTNSNAEEHHDAPLYMFLYSLICENSSLFRIYSAVEVSRWMGNGEDNRHLLTTPVWEVVA